MLARSMRRPVVLVTNDDGIHAKGLHALEAALATVGRVVTVAPETEQSAMSHAMTLSRPLRLRQLAPHRYAVDGTPVDCVYVAMLHAGVLPARPLLVVSGINHGLNLGSDVFYSGTVAAAREGAMRGVPAIAISLASGGDIVGTAELARALAEHLLSLRFEASATPLLNVNVPRGRIRGIAATRLGPRVYEDLVDIRQDPRGRHYLWIGGPSVVQPRIPGTDTAAHDRGWVSVTPLGVDLVNTAHLPMVDATVAAVSVEAREIRSSGRARANGATKRAPSRARKTSRSSASERP